MTDIVNHLSKIETEESEFPTIRGPGRDRLIVISTYYPLKLNVTKKFPYNLSVTEP